MRAHDQTLSAALAECTTSVACIRDVNGGNALAAYDELARRLAAGPVTVTLPDERGRDQERTFTLADLGTVATAAVPDVTGRMLLQRAVAAASQDRWWYLVRMLDLARASDADRLSGPATAIRCADHARDAAIADPAADWLATGRDAGLTATRLGHLFATDLPCATWPAGPGTDAASAIVDPGYPLILLGATLDPVTPWANGERIASRAGTRNTHTIVTAGGSHGTFGRGSSCPDRFISAFLVVDRDPPERTTCSGDHRRPLPGAAERHAQRRQGHACGAHGSRHGDRPRARSRWPGTAPGTLRFGCPAGGWIRYTAGAVQTTLELDRCAWTPGVPLTGSGLHRQRQRRHAPHARLGRPRAPRHVRPHGQG